MINTGTVLVGVNVNGEYCIHYTVGGVYFLVNAFAEVEHRQTLIDLGPPETGSFLLYTIPSHIDVIDATPWRIGKRYLTPVLYCSTEQICLIGREAAKANLDFLNTVNRASWQTHYINKQPGGTIKESTAIAKG